MNELEKKEATAERVALKGNIGIEFAEMTLYQIQQIRKNRVSQVDPLILKEIRENTRFSLSLI